MPPDLTPNTLAILASCTLAAGALGQAHETPATDPPGLPRPALPVPPRGGPDGPAGAQVNTDALGRNIAGDAANEPSIAVDPTAPNRMAIGWRQFGSIQSNFREAGAAYSRDGGRTWTSVGPLDPGIFRSDPVLRSDAAGRFYYYSLSLPGTNQYRCEMFTSMDHGATWSGPTPAFGGDKAWIAIDLTPGPGRGNVYAAWDLASIFAPLGFTRSSDGGQSYMQAIEVPGPPEWGQCDVGPGGEFYVAGKLGRPGSNFRFARSRDAWNNAITPTFDPAVTINLGGAMRAFPNTGPNPGGLTGQVNLSVDRSNGPRRGWIYILCSVRRTGAADALDVMLIRSTDGGSTWSAPVRVNDTTGDAWDWFGTLSVSPDGRLDVVFNTTPPAAPANSTHLRYTSSSDGGATWAASVPLSPVFNSHLGWPNQNKLGDYYDMRSDLVGADLAWAATFNGEQDVYYMRLGDYDCNGNGIGDTQDLLSGFAADCNGNDIPDSCEIAAGTVPDRNRNGIPDECECYPDCDTGGGPRVLDIFDFLCFQNRYAAGDPYACDCDTSTGVGVCDVFDFLCFQNAFAGGCP